jgi:hypothetical protein
MGWAEVLTALSTAAIALMLIGACAAFLFLMRDVRKLMAELESLTKTLGADGKPAVESLRTMIADASGVVATVKTERRRLMDSLTPPREYANAPSALPPPSMTGYMISRLSWTWYNRRWRTQPSTSPRRCAPPGAAGSCSNG